jgi:hypothetical protein
MSNLLTESVCSFCKTSGRLSFLAKYVMSKSIYGAGFDGTLGYSEGAWYSAQKSDF